MRHRGRQAKTGKHFWRQPAVASLGVASSSFSSRPSRRTSRRGYHAVVATTGLLLMLWTGGSSGQFTDGGDIAMACGECDCSGTSDAGSVIVFEDPSSGGKVREQRGLGLLYLVLSSHRCDTRYHPPALDRFSKLEFLPQHEECQC